MHRLSFTKCQFIQDADFLHSGLSLYYLGSVHTWYRGTPPQYGNYLAPKLSSTQVPVKDLILKHKIWHWVSLCTLILLLLGQSTAVYSLLSSCSTMGSDRAKWSNYVHRVLFHYSRCGPNTFVYWYTLVGTGSWAQNVDSPLLT